MCLHAVLLLASVFLAGEPPADPAFEFRDREDLDGRAMLSFRNIVLRPDPARDVEFESAPTGSVSYGVIPIGDAPENALTLVFSENAEGSPTVWIDADADGRLASSERRELSATRLDIPVDLVLGASGGDPPRRFPRTLILRRGLLQRGLQYAVRGYRVGRLRIGEQTHAAALTDGDADGLFDRAGADRLLIDLNDDGAFDAFTEQYPLGKPLTVAGVVYAVRADPLGESAIAQTRSTESGMLRLQLGVKGDPRIEKLDLALVSDIGELIHVNSIAEPIRVPVSTYRVSYLLFDMKDADQNVWHYRFSGARKYDVAVAAEQTSRIDLLADLTLDASLAPRLVESLLYRDYSVTPTVKTSAGLVLTSCSQTVPREPRPLSMEAVIYVTARQGGEQFNVRSGFT